MQTLPAALRVAQSVATLVGASDSLESINASQLSDRALVTVALNNSIYMLRKDSVAAESLPDVVAPKQGGPGRWFVYSSGGSDGGLYLVGPVIADTDPYTLLEIPIADLLPGTGAVSLRVTVAASVSVSAYYVMVRDFLAVYLVSDPGSGRVLNAGGAGSQGVASYADYYGNSQIIGNILFDAPGGTSIRVRYDKTSGEGGNHKVAARITVIQALLVDP